MKLESFDLTQKVEIAKTNLKYLPYSINGKYCNNGELCEEALKICLNAKEKRLRNNRPFYNSTDIEELGISVKAYKATIPNMNGSSDKLSLIDSYITQDVAKMYAYCIFNFNTMTLTTIYFTPAEFAKLLYDLGSYDKNRQVVRLYKADSTVLKWCIANGLE